MNEQLQTVLERIRRQKPSRLAPPAVPPRCTRCNDTHMIEMIGGEYQTPRGLTITATPEEPVYRPCECRRFRTSQPAQPREF